MPTTADGSIIVRAPISAVYALWTQFEEFPRFMGGVTSVRFLTDTRLEWVAEPEGGPSAVGG
ncbi:SRPBCC family protein [Nesterenkonia halotolerans]|uniref:Membrane protein n=1 Tax=Nesterenkonia halotolerans TaxID=225325 RepID=A0ABR9J781_9MICC|nr:putative membrane protein [Nesterenkonia halotolerans]